MQGSCRRLASAMTLEEEEEDQSPNPETPPWSKIRRDRMEQRKCRGRATARGAMEKSRYVRIIGGRRSEEMTHSSTSSPRGSEVPFESQTR